MGSSRQHAPSTLAMVSEGWDVGDGGGGGVGDGGGDVGDGGVGRGRWGGDVGDGGGGTWEMGGGGVGDRGVRGGEGHRPTIEHSTLVAMDTGMKRKACCQYGWYTQNGFSC